ncbi:MAG TPA: hypothetical protein VJ729_14510 [Nitrososphaeraceae archaeon]|nr:hypothetical protein [Nitrososphaeraceae archaeon]
MLKRLLSEHSDFDNIILLFKIVGDKRHIHVKNPMYYWTSENYDVFLRKIFEEINWHDELRENILKRIAKNERWYKEVQKYHDGMREEKYH